MVDLRAQMPHGGVDADGCSRQTRNPFSTPVRTGSSTPDAAPRSLAKISQRVLLKRLKPPPSRAATFCHAVIPPEEHRRRCRYAIKRCRCHYLRYSTDCRASFRRTFTTRAHTLLSLLVLTSGAVLIWTCLRDEQLEGVGVQDNLHLTPVLEDFTAVSATLFLVLGVLGLVASVFLSGLLYLHVTMATVSLASVVFAVVTALFAQGYIMRLHVSVLVKMLN